MKFLNMKLVFQSGNPKEVKKEYTHKKSYAVNIIIVMEVQKRQIEINLIKR